MLRLRTKVVVTDIVQGVARELTGTVVGVTREAKPHYDVLVNGRVLTNIPCERVREATNRRDIFGIVGGSAK